MLLEDPAFLLHDLLNVRSNERCPTDLSTCRASLSLQKKVFQANLGALLENHRRLLDDEDVSTVRVPPVTADDDVVQIGEEDQLSSYPPAAS